MQRREMKSTPAPNEYTEEYFLTNCGGFKEYLKGEIPLRHIKALEYLQANRVKSKVVDIVTCLQTLEHFERDDGLRLIGEMERIARRQVIITTPVGDWQQPPSDTNPHDEHKCT